MIGNKIIKYLKGNLLILLAKKAIKPPAKIEEKKAEDALKKVEDSVSAIDGQEVVIPVKLGEEGQLFESINAQKISEKMKKPIKPIDKIYKFSPIMSKRL